LQTPLLAVLPRLHVDARLHVLLLAQQRPPAQCQVLYQTHADAQSIQQTQVPPHVAEHHFHAAAVRHLCRRTRREGGIHLAGG